MGDYAFSSETLVQPRGSLKDLGFLMAYKTEILQEAD